MRGEELSVQPQCSDPCSPAETIDAGREAVLLIEYGSEGPRAMGDGSSMRLLHLRRGVFRKRRPRAGSDGVACDLDEHDRTAKPTRSARMRNSSDPLSQSNRISDVSVVAGEYQGSRLQDLGAGVQEALLRREKLATSERDCAETSVPLYRSLDRKQKRFMPALKPSGGRRPGREFTLGRWRTIEPPCGDPWAEINKASLSKEMFGRRRQLASAARRESWSVEIFSWSTTDQDHGSVRRATHDGGSMAPRRVHVMVDRGRMEVVHRGCVTCGREALRLRTTHGGGVWSDSSQVSRGYRCSVHGGMVPTVARGPLWVTGFDHPLRWKSRSRLCRSREDARDWLAWKGADPASKSLVSWANSSAMSRPTPQECYGSSEASAERVI